MEKNTQGFTLIEILIVVVIIAITVSFALFSFGDFGASRRAVVAAEELLSYINLLKQQAILENHSFGIAIKPSYYQIFQLAKDNAWKLIPNRQQTFPSGVTAYLNTHSTSLAPQIIINASGGINAFNLSFGTEKLPTVIKLIGKYNGEISLTKPGL